MRNCSDPQEKGISDDRAPITGIQIRTASGEEMLDLWGYQDPGAASPTARFFHRNITEGNAVFWTLDRNGELIGELYAFLKLEDRDFADGKTTAYLCAFRVRKEYRGLGLGSRMMKTVLDDLRSKGFRRATIGVGVSEERNRKMYSRLGFRTTIKTCHADPCAMDGNMQPAADAEGFLLLSKAL